MIAISFWWNSPLNKASPRIAPETKQEIAMIAARIDGRRINSPRQPLLVPIRILPMMRAITPTIRTTRVPTRKVPKTAHSSGARVVEEQIT